MPTLSVINFYSKLLHVTVAFDKREGREKKESLAAT